MVTMHIQSLATGFLPLVSHIQQDFTKAAFDFIKLNWEDYVETNQKYGRPNEVKHLLGDASKAKKILKWSPKTSFSDLVKMMVENDIHKARKIIN